MLNNIFHTILKMSCMTSVVAILLLSAKYVFQKLGCPRKIMFLLWSIIAFRLICPVSISTDISLFNVASTFDKQHYTSELQMKKSTNSTSDVIRYEANPNENNHSQEQIKTIDKYRLIEMILSSVWFVGMSIMILFGAVSFILLKNRLRFAIKLKENIYTAENIPTSFVFGIFKLKIFIPESTEEKDLENIIVHEKMHIKRADHVTKVVAYILLSVYWFNPLTWIMFKIFSDDMELACDEDVIKKIGIENKKQYLNTLLVSAMHKQKTILLYNVCFSANSTKRRVKNMIKLKKHSRVAAITGIVICLLAAVVFGTNAAERKDEQDSIAAIQTTIPFPVDDNNTINELYSAETNDTDNVETPIKERQTENISAVAAINNHTAPKASAAPVPTPQTQVTETVKNDISEKPQVDSIDFMQNIFEDDMKMANVEQNLIDKGITAISGNHVKLGENYILSNYSYEDNCNDTISNVSCDNDGNISLYFDVNAENLVDVTFTDSATKEVVAEFGILANDVNSYSFTGFDEEKSYDVTVQGKTDNTWKIEGQYIIY